MTAVLDDLAGIYGQLYDDWLHAATRVLDVVEHQSRKVGAALPGISQLSASGCRCEIPPPCWMPRELGERVSKVCPGHTATICLRIVNCGASPQTATVQTGTDGEGVSITNSPLELAPMEEGAVVVSYTADPSCEHDESRRLLLWVRGCNEHLLRWTVKVCHDTTGTCHHVEVADCPDNVHHWYDHFYCAHQCSCQHD